MASDPTEWREAPDLLEMAQPIIDAHHEHLQGYPLRILWRSKMRKVGGAYAAATAEIVQGRNASLLMSEGEKAMEGQESGFKFFLIEVAEDAWESFSDKQRLALLDHELMHCGVDDEGEMTTIPHDRELFYAEIERHGLWEKRLEKIADTILSLPMP